MIQIYGRIELIEIVNDWIFTTNLRIQWLDRYTISKSTEVVKLKFH